MSGVTYRMTDARRAEFDRRFDHAMGKLAAQIHSAQLQARRLDYGADVHRVGEHLAAEAARYLDAVATFREEGCNPVHV